MISIFNITNIFAIGFLLIISIFISLILNFYTIINFGLLYNKPSKNESINNIISFPLTILSQIITKIKTHHKKQLKSNKENINLFINLLVFSIIIIVLLFSFGYYFGKKQAKEKKTFWITSYETNTKLVEIYREQDFILFCPCYIATDSITIDNRYIIKRTDRDCLLQRYTFKTINLVVDQAGTINQDLIINK